MPENPNRVEVARRVEKAEKLLQKGKTADALAEYLQILEGDPQNDNVRQVAADLCLSLNKGAQAVRLLGELFERQVAAADATDRGHTSLGEPDLQEAGAVCQPKLGTESALWATAGAIEQKARGRDV